MPALSNISREYREGFAEGYFTAWVYFQRRLRNIFRAITGTDGYQKELFAWIEEGGSLPRIDNEEGS